MIKSVNIFEKVFISLWLIPVIYCDFQRRNMSGTCNIKENHTIKWGRKHLKISQFNENFLRICPKKWAKLFLNWAWNRRWYFRFHNFIFPQGDTSSRYSGGVTNPEARAIPHSCFHSLFIIFSSSSFFLPFVSVSLKFPLWRREHSFITRYYPVYVDLWITVNRLRICRTWWPASLERGILAVEGNKHSALAPASGKREVHIDPACINRLVSRLCLWLGIKQAVNY